MALGDELASLNFESMIGGPLIAVIKAQTQSSIAAVDFIKAVGFDHNSDGDITGPTMVSFTYSKPVEQRDQNGVVTVVPKPYQLTVPFLTMLPIPFIRIEETTIDFNAKITSVNETSSSTQHGLNAELGGKAGWGPVSVSLKVSYSFKKSTASSEKIERTYSMAVHVRAVQDELPAGTERLLSILENAIKETPVAA